MAQVSVHIARDAVLHICVPKALPIAMMALQPTGKTSRAVKKKTTANVAISRAANVACIAISLSRLCVPTGFAAETPIAFINPTKGTERSDVPGGK